MRNIAYITYDHDVSESVVGFYEIEFTSNHVVFRMNENDKNEIIAVKADRIYELVTEKEE